MADTLRGRPYIWATWITKLIAGEDRCWYRAWYKAHYKFEKTPDDADRKSFFEEWTARHDEIVRRRVEELKDQGFILKVEDDAKVTVRGKSADLVLKPDIVAMIDEAEALVIDAKAGKRRESDHWQVLLYLFGLTLAGAYLFGFKTRGEVSYPEDNVPVRVLDDYAKKKIVESIAKVADTVQPKASPSERECRFCDVASCEFRKRDESGDATRYF